MLVYFDEVYRFDCFGGSEGHFHVNMTQLKVKLPRRTARCYFPPGSIPEQIERAAFELETNLNAVLLANDFREVRRVEVDAARLSEAAEFMRRKMQELLETNA